VARSEHLVPAFELGGALTLYVQVRAAEECLGLGGLHDLAEEVSDLGQGLPQRVGLAGCRLSAVGWHRRLKAVG
jgi:hypothetical protein